MCGLQELEAQNVYIHVGVWMLLIKEHLCMSQLYNILLYILQHTVCVTHRIAGNNVFITPRNETSSFELKHRTVHVCMIAALCTYTEPHEYRAVVLSQHLYIYCFILF